ncbi:hypothetical protein RI570_04260 [Brucella pseudogrignonensis]|uniref:hypothetical protein n=1 Tax=Brucella pseudogrignonensis TaxID=419475 RepID=UPI0028BAEA00|nr:hypothetical protein [Brucella pseudogrignonensis]MDT6939357.1 hypothetical protein [Brucella pseudogrignonensis]
MTSVMWKLRNALWAAPGYIDWADKKRFRWLSEGNEQQRTVLMEALGFGHPLRGKAARCGRIEDPDTNYMRRCGIPLCPRCFMTERSKQIKQATRQRFVGVANEQLAFATILLPVATTLSGVSNIIDTEKTRMRNMVSLKRRKDSRWNNFEILGWWETDRMTYSDFEEMGRNSQIALKQLGIPLVWYDDATIWRPHLHAIVRLDQLSVSEVADAFRNNGYGAAYQVNIKPFTASQRVGLNIKSVIQYALKFRIEADFKSADSNCSSGKYDLANRKWWPAKDVKAYAEWLCEKNSGFQSLRFSLGVKGKRASAVVANSASNNLSAKSGASLMQVIADDDLDGIELLEDAFDDRFDQTDGVEVDDGFVDEDPAHGICVEDEGVINGGSSVIGIRYKNPYSDTNWTEDASEGHSDRVPFAVDWSSKFAGNVIGLKERLRGIAIARHDDASNGSMGRG